MKNIWQDKCISFHHLKPFKKTGTRDLKRKCIADSYQNIQIKSNKKVGDLPCNIFTVCVCDWHTFVYPACVPIYNVPYVRRNKKGDKCVRDS